MSAVAVSDADIPEGEATEAGGVKSVDADLMSQAASKSDATTVGNSKVKVTLFIAYLFFWAPDMKASRMKSTIASISLLLN